MYNKLLHDTNFISREVLEDFFREIEIPQDDNVGDSNPPDPENSHGQERTATLDVNPGKKKEKKKLNVYQKNRTVKISALLKDNSEIICIQELRLLPQEDTDKVKQSWTKGQSFLSIGDQKADLFKDETQIIKAREIIPERILFTNAYIKKTQNADYQCLQPIR